MLGVGGWGWGGESSNILSVGLSVCSSQCPFICPLPTKLLFFGGRGGGGGEGEGVITYAY